MHNVETIWIWFGFSLFLIIAVSFDAFLVPKKYARPHHSMRAAVYWTLLWVSCALVFNFIFWLYLYYTQTLAIANTQALLFLTGYLIEKSLSIDNLFVFYLIFHQFRIPLANQQRILSYGIWGAIIMRLLLILLGVWLIAHFHWLLYLMGAFLVYTGIKIVLVKEREKNLADSWLMRGINKIMRTTHELQGEHFFIRKGRWWYATPLFVALIFVEFSDLVFALDSIPAIFAITTDPFIVWSSNIFAILGLRALYFLLAGMVEKFRILKYGIALILVFVGVKMMIEPWLQIPVWLSLSVIVLTITVFIIIGSRQACSR